MSDPFTVTGFGRPRQASKPENAPEKPPGAGERDEIPSGPSLSSLPLPPLATASEPVPLFNRELSWLEFNQRVVEEAGDPSVPLLERVRFLAIASNNLDEFFMVRVGSLRDMISAGIKERSADGLTPRQQLKAVRSRVRRQLREMYTILEDDLLPGLKRNGVRLVDYDSLSSREQTQLSEHFEQQIAPILTPLAFDPGHPFPFLANLSLNLAIQLESERGEEHVVFLKLPTNVPRLMRVGEGHRYALLGPLIA
ncbi:MAG: RNA degradosome polyphosphate kinase, partial [Acidobacteria bacterium]|nr:RNA degradosome polyphosphate kinase [Acidobacteriota bacterium]